MIYKRTGKLLKKVDKLARRLYIAREKLYVARNAYHQARATRGVDPLIVATALQGIPLTRRMLGDMYQSSADRDLAKILKELESLKEKLKASYFYLYVAVESILQRILRDLSESTKQVDVEAKIEIVDRAYSSMVELRSRIDYMLRSEQR